MSSSLSGHPAEASKPKLLDHAPGVKNLPLLEIAHVLVRFGHVLYKIADSWNYWEIIADNLSKAGWSWGCVLAIDSKGRTIWIADAHRDNGERFVVRADEKSTAFLEVESAIREASGKLLKEVFVEGRLSCDLNRATKNIARLQNSHRV